MIDPSSTDMLTTARAGGSSYGPISRVGSGAVCPLVTIHVLGTFAGHWLPLSLLGTGVALGPVGSSPPAVRRRSAGLLIGFIAGPVGYSRRSSANIPAPATI
ncbi:hypothetical protein EF834_04580 [Rhodococcus spongiicola]|uniref:Uncharacterized protein n=1 Tax=Rhodococcus spongiicola TaxID=2487352 RepID=A0A3S3ZRK6_9NOCA|nr:hypothetical protein EF834_04580 [Rhodococcus spongiicola]